MTCIIIIILVLLGLLWFSQQESFTLPFDGGYVYGPYYGGMADKEVEADSLLT